VLAGVALAIVLFVVEQSNRVVVKQLHLDEHGHIRESDPPDVVPPGQVILLQPFGSLFFASATAFNEALPAVTADTTHSVVILRLRGIDDLGVSITNVVVRLATDLAGADSKLLVNGGEQLRARLAKSGALDQIGVDNFYLGDAWHGRTLRKADVDGRRWIAEQTGANGE
jgi:SulP family sulfate permease